MFCNSYKNLFRTSNKKSASGYLPKADYSIYLYLNYNNDSGSKFSCSISKKYL